MISILSMKGHILIPKSFVDEAKLGMMRTNDFAPQFVDFAELEALGERHLGCGHDI